MKFSSHDKAQFRRNLPSLRAAAAEHTQGPWRKGAPIVVNLGGFKVHAFPISGSGMAIAAVYNGSVGKEAMPGQGEANADLVANAPAMFAALQHIAREGRKVGAGSLSRTQLAAYADATIAQAKADVARANQDRRDAMSPADRRVHDREVTS